MREAWISGDKVDEVTELRAELAQAKADIRTNVSEHEKTLALLAAAKNEIAKLREEREPGIVLAAQRDAALVREASAQSAMVQARQSKDGVLVMYANAIGECRKINKAIHRVLRGRNNANKQLSAEKAAREIEEELHFKTLQRADRAEARVRELEENISPEVLRELNARQSEREK